MQLIYSLSPCSISPKWWCWRSAGNLWRSTCARVSHLMTNYHKRGGLTVISAMTFQNGWERRAGKRESRGLMAFRQSSWGSTWDLMLKKETLIVAKRPTHQPPPSWKTLSYWSRLLFPRLERHLIGTEIENGGERGMEGKGRGESNTWQGGCQVRKPRTWEMKHRPSGEVHVLAFPALWLPVLAVSCPRLPPGRWENEEKHLWVKWCEKERLRAVATFTQEMASLRQRRPPLLRLMRWKRSRERVEERREGGGCTEDGGGQREDDEGREIQGLVSEAESLSVSTLPCNL